MIYKRINTIDSSEWRLILNEDSDNLQLVNFAIKLGFESADVYEVISLSKNQLNFSWRDLNKFDFD